MDKTYFIHPYSLDLINRKVTQASFFSKWIDHANKQAALPALKENKH